MMHQQEPAGDSLDPPVWKVAIKALSLSLSLSRSLALSRSLSLSLSLALSRSLSRSRDDFRALLPEAVAMRLALMQRHTGVPTST